MQHLENSFSNNNSNNKRSTSKTNRPKLRYLNDTYKIKQTLKIAARKNMVRKQSQIKMWQKDFEMAYNGLNPSNERFKTEVTSAKQYKNGRRKRLKASKLKPVTIKRNNALQGQKFETEIYEEVKKQNEYYENRNLHMLSEIITIKVIYQVVYTIQQNKTKKLADELKTVDEISIAMKIFTDSLSDTVNRDKQTIENLQLNIENKNATIKKLEQELKEIKNDVMSKDEKKTNSNKKIKKMKEQFDQSSTKKKTEKKVFDFLPKITKIQHENKLTLQNFKNAFEKTKNIFHGSSIQKDLTASSVKTNKETDKVEEKFQKKLTPQKSLANTQKSDYQNIIEQQKSWIKNLIEEILKKNQNIHINTVNKDGKRLRNKLNEDRHSARKINSAKKSKNSIKQKHDQTCNEKKNYQGIDKKLQRLRNKHDNFDHKSDNQAEKFEAREPIKKREACIISSPSTSHSSNKKLKPKNSKKQSNALVEKNQLNLKETLDENQLSLDLQSHQVQTAFIFEHLITNIPDNEGKKTKERKRQLLTSIAINPDIKVKEGVSFTSTTTSTVISTNSPTQNANDARNSTSICMISDDMESIKTTESLSFFSTSMDLKSGEELKNSASATTTEMETASEFQKSQIINNTFANIKNSESR